MKKKFLLRTVLVASTALFLTFTTAAAQTLHYEVVKKDLMNNFVKNGETPSIEDNAEVQVANFSQAYSLLVAACGESSREENEKGQKYECGTEYRIVLHDYWKADKDKEVTTGTFVAKIELNIEKNGSKKRYRNIYFVK
jgi:hypothetical protein